MSLAHYYDPGLTGAHTRDVLVGEDRAALQVLIAICESALAMRRRLGGDATSAELANDKKTARRLRHCFLKSLLAWGGQEIDAGPPRLEVRRLAAVANWKHIVDQRHQWILSRYAPYATLAIDAGQEQWGYSVLNRLNNELSWLDYAIR